MFYPFKFHEHFITNTETVAFTFGASIFFILFLSLKCYHNISANDNLNMYPHIHRYHPTPSLGNVSLQQLETITENHN